MRVRLELVVGIFLICYLILPFQNDAQATRLLVGCTLLWLTALIVWRNRSLITFTIFFHFVVLTAFHLRAMQAQGAITEWFFWLAIGQWIFVLYLTAKRPDYSAAPSIFLSVCFISPFYLSILNASQDAIWGIPIWSILVLHAGLALRAEEIRIPRMFLVLLGVCLISIPFAIYAWHGFQFFTITGVCILLYCIANQSYVDDPAPFRLGYLFLGSSLIFFGIVREIVTLQGVGSAVLGMRHYFVEHPNTIAPILIILSTFTLKHLTETKSQPGRAVLMALVLSFGVLQFFTYSRSGWIAHLCFLLLILVLYLKKKLASRYILMAFGTLAILLILFFSISSIRETISIRTLDAASTRARIFNWSLAVKAISISPVFGSGWMNYYGHTRIVEDEPLQLVSYQAWIPVHNHSFYLDIAEAGGIPLSLIFLWITAAHLWKTRRNVILFAGLVGITVNNLLDTAALWLTVYAHFWVLLAFATPGGVTARSIRGVKISLPVLAILFLFACLLPLIEDHYLLKASFFAKNNSPDKSYSALRIARLAAPFDAAPLESLTDFHLSQNNPDQAKRTLHSLIQIRKYYAPYHQQLGRISLEQGKLEESHQHLTMAAKLDPQNGLMDQTFVSLAFLFGKLQEQEKLKEYTCLSFLYLLRPGYDFRPRLIIREESESKFLENLLEYAIERSRNAEDRIAAIDNLHTNLTTFRAGKTAILLLERLLLESDFLNQSEKDYFSYLLAGHYLDAGRPDAMERLRSIVSSKARPLLEARIQILNGEFHRAQENLKQSLNYYSYPDLSQTFQALYEKSKQSDKLRAHYRILKNLPVPGFDSNPQMQIAHSFAKQGKYADAAREYNLLSQYQFEDPSPHWLEARMWFQAGNLQNAEKANDRLQSLVPSNWFTENLYRSEILASLENVQIRRAPAPNRWGGTSWRTGIYAHPPSTIRFPQSGTLQRMVGEVAVVLNAWVEETDGVEFAIYNHSGKKLFSKTIHPFSDPSQRSWNPFQWTAIDPHSIVLQTNQLENANFDWAMWVIATPDN
jgi:Tfp pilus assembly protein PilF